MRARNDVQPCYNCTSARSHARAPTPAHNMRGMSTGLPVIRGRSRCPFRTEPWHKGCAQKSRGCFKLITRRPTTKPRRARPAPICARLPAHSGPRASRDALRRIRASTTVRRTRASPRLRGDRRAWRFLRRVEAPSCAVSRRPRYLVARASSVPRRCRQNAQRARDFFRRLV